MREGKKYHDPDEYVASLGGWQRDMVRRLREGVRQVERFEEVVRWGHLVYQSGGPAVLIRAEDERVLFGFWRGKRLREIEPRLKPSGKYEMATVEILEGDEIANSLVERLAEAAADLNDELGDPRKDAR